MAWTEYKEPLMRSQGGDPVIRVVVAKSGRVEVIVTPTLAREMGFDKEPGFRLFFDSEKPVFGLVVDRAGVYTKPGTGNLLALKQALSQKGCPLNKGAVLKAIFPPKREGEKPVVAFDYSVLLPPAGR